MEVELVRGSLLLARAIAREFLNIPGLPLAEMVLSTPPEPGSLLRVEGAGELMRFTTGKAQRRDAKQK